MVCLTILASWDQETLQNQWFSNNFGFMRPRNNTKPSSVQPFWLPETSKLYKTNGFLTILGSWNQEAWQNQRCCFAIWHVPTGCHLPPLRRLIQWAISRRSCPPARLAPSHHLTTSPFGKFPADVYATRSQGCIVIHYQWTIAAPYTSDTVKRQLSNPATK